jgi:hypothetical protein
MTLIKKSSISLILALLLYLGLFALTGSTSWAVPNLQLDIAGGTYDAKTQTIVAPGDRFTLYAFMTGLSLSDTYYISAALAPMTNDPNQGTFIFNSTYSDTTYNGTRINNTVNFATDIYKDYGTPPHYDYDYQKSTKYLPYDTGDLSQHGVYETIFKEFKVVFKDASKIAPYDTALRAQKGDPIVLSATGSMFYATFEVDTSRLLPGNAIHFDLYTLVNSGGDLDIGNYAPFAYDAESLDPPATGSVPDASIMFLLGPALVGLGLLGRRRFKK